MFLLKKSNYLIRLLKQKSFDCSSLWTYVAIAFNKVDNERLKLVGPDRLCAEWILKNGGAVSFVQSPGKYLRDYNVLPSESTRIQIKEIDATGSSIMKLGMEHLKSCKHIDRMILHRCKHLENDGLQALPYIKQTLRHLQISSCYNIDDEGLMVLKELTELKTLRMFDLTSVSDLESLVGQITPHLPECNINIESTDM